MQPATLETIQWSALKQQTVNQALKVKHTKNQNGKIFIDRLVATDMAASQHKYVNAKLSTDHTHCNLVWILMCAGQSAWSVFKSVYVRVCEYVWVWVCNFWVKILSLVIRVQSLAILCAQQCLLPHITVRE